MTLPDEFLLIDRIIHNHPDLADILLKSEDIAFALSVEKCEQVMRYQSNLIANWSSLLAVKKGDIMKYKGFKIHAV